MYIHTSSPHIDGDEVYTEWRLFKRALAKVRKGLVKKKQQAKATNTTRT